MPRSSMSRWLAGLDIFATSLSVYYASLHMNSECTGLTISLGLCQGWKLPIRAQELELEDGRGYSEFAL